MKHITASGSVAIDSLLNDRQLKTAIAIGQDYGADVMKVWQAGQTGEQTVDKRFTNIYAFEPVRSLSDPRATYISVTCGDHPETIAAMPTINKIIARIRSPRWEVSNSNYRIALTGTGKLRSYYQLPTWKFASEMATGQTESWYPLQQAHWPELRQYPDTTAPVTPLKDLPARDHQPRWYLFEPSPQVIYIVNEGDLRAIRRLKIGDPDRDEDVHPSNWDQMFKMVARKELELCGSAKAVAHAPAIAKLPLASLQNIRKLVVLGRGVVLDEAKALQHLLKQPSLRDFTFLAAGYDVAPWLVDNLPAQLHSLNLNSAILRSKEISSKIATMDSLRSLDLANSQLDGEDLLRILQNLPKSLEQLNLDRHPARWTLVHGQAFGKGTFPKLKELRLNVNDITNEIFAAMEPAIPATLEILELGFNALAFDAVAPCLARPCAANGGTCPQPNEDQA